MIKTDHAKLRILQRHFDERIINLVYKYGKVLPDNKNRYVLNYEDISTIEKNENLSITLKKQLEKSVPLVCVFCDDELVTVFRQNKRINRRWN